MKRSYCIAAAVAVLIVVFAADTFAQRVTGKLEARRPVRGSVHRGEIVIDLQPDLHINSNRPDRGYLIPTSVSFKPVRGVRVISIRYPRAKSKKFPFSPTPMRIYEGVVKIPFAVRIDRGFSGERLILHAQVQYQACTDEVCLSPANMSLTVGLPQRPTYAR